MLTILERLRAHCFPTTYKTLFISKPEQHHRMTRHHYCPCNNSWIELYAFFCQPLPKLQLVVDVSLQIHGANSFFFFTPTYVTAIKFSKHGDWWSYNGSFLSCFVLELLFRPAKYSQKCRHSSEQSTGRQKPLNCLCEGLLVNYKSDFEFCYFAVHFWESFCFAYF